MSGKNPSMAAGNGGHLALALAMLALVTARPCAAEPLICTVEPSGAPAVVVERVTSAQDSLEYCKVEIVGSVRMAVPRGYDVYIVVDSSGSTAGASGLDLDGDGVEGVGDWRTNTDHDDSTLHAELESVRRAVTAWLPQDVRVSLEEFSAVIPIPPGEPSEQGRIRTVQGL